MCHGKIKSYFCFKCYVLTILYCLHIMFVLACLMAFNATVTIFQLFRGGQYYWLREPEEPEKTTDQSQVTDTLYHKMSYTSPWARFELTTSVIIGTDCIGSCKSNYHTITDTTGSVSWYYMRYCDLQAVSI